MPRRKIPMSERTHGVRATYVAGCRCDDCTEAHRAYSRERYLRTKATKDQPEALAAGELRELRIPVTCPNCGGAVVQQTPSATTSSGMRVTQMLRCPKNGCNRQWQFVGVLMSLSGAEYQGAA